MEEHFRNLLIYALPVIFAITVSEAAHAFAAKYFGDNTAYAAGRMTLNPFAHIDPLGTIVIPAVLYLVTGFAFGYAKPVPLDASRLRNPRRDMAWVALAGPASNLLMAAIWLVVAILLQYFQVSESFPNLVARAGVLANLLIFTLNLIPIPPLDGGRVVTSILPLRMAIKFAAIEPYGLIIVLALMAFQLLNIWIVPVYAVGQQLVQWMAYPVQLLLS